MVLFLASSSVTLIISLIAPELGQAAMCGTFAGMSNGRTLAPSQHLAVMLGLLTAALFEIMFLGLGVRFGFTAFLRVNAMALVQRVSIQNANAAMVATVEALRRSVPW